MENNVIEVNRWRNSIQNDKSGVGYGIRIPISKYSLLENWQTIIISDTEEILERANRSFTKKCPEIRSKLIGSYMIRNKLIGWQKRKTAKLKLEIIGNNVFRLFS